MKEKGWMKKMKYKGLEDHYRRMRELKPSIDCGPPRKAISSKRRELDRHRHYASIEYDNQLMLQRLARVVQKKTIDNDRPRMKAIGTEQAKRAEFRRITHENKLMLKRIEETTPVYNHKKWEEDAKKREYYIANMTEFPENYSTKDFLSTPQRRPSSAYARSSPVRSRTTSKRPSTATGSLQPLMSAGRPNSASPKRLFYSR
mmetsp:Transcript_22132/g.32227  ORF Transcript_22132/g.32227 Transcript_22132/m.32227 type:complete len:202 (-) Transcript_22132:268-873(-)|eukprot:CAMPEP_0185032796 /NCGR_PEP_ID=MMETSP1103-20130426/21202_1 /TAXON_ID=36769 /ORGANISM="Paraphysomonas bandaiensis, Strain Caron Lab Isolate" /LENGTH=201 /DNA_ID=CAMNT_0027568819 /DNA_START=101 /DNA_END=706 /DNA_ORIENTATION=+